MRSALIATFVVARMAFGQQGDTARAVADTTRLPAIRIIGSVLQAADGPHVGSGVPARVIVISGNHIRASNPRTLAQALEAEAGMSLYDDLGSPAKLTLVSRGFTSSPVVGLPQGLSVFVDGVPVNEPDAGQVNFDLLPLAHADRVELLSGTATLLGPHSLGGAVNIVTEAGRSASGGELELTAASFGGFGTRLALRGTSASGWSLFAGGSYADEGGWRQLTDASQRLGLVNVGRYGADRGARLQLMYSQSLAETAGSLPLSIFRLQPDSNLSAGDFEDLNQLHVALAAYASLGRGHSSATVFFRRSDAERFNVNQAADPDVRNFATNSSLGVIADWRTTFVSRRGVIGLRVGAGGSSHHSRVRIFAERLEPGLTTHVESPIGKADAFSVLDYSTGPLSLSAGARYDLTRIPFRNRLNSARDTTSIFAQLSPRAGFTLSVGRGVSLFGSAGRSFRPPALIELACADPDEPCPLPFALGDDPPLAPVIASTVEAGARWATGPALLSASAYLSNVRDDIFLLPYDDASEPEGSTIDGFFANLPRTRRQGVEVASRAAIGRAELFANYAWTRATFQVSGVEIFSIREEAGAENQIEVGDRLPLVPEHTLSLGGSAPLGRRLHAGLAAQYTGERVLRGDEANDEAPLPAYWVFDGWLGAHVRDWAVRVAARNILNERHATFGTFNINQGAAGGAALERFLTPGAPRRLQLSVMRSFR